MQFNTIKQLLKLTVFLKLLFIFSACKPEPIAPKGDYETGVFVVNEGVYSNTSGSISYYNITEKTVQNKIFNAVNSRDLGDVVQSMTFHQERAYIVVNNANKIEAVDANTFEEKGQVLGLELPRYFLPISDQQAYVSEWGSDGKTGRISLIDLEGLSVVKTISTNKQGPERMLLWNNKVFVVNVGGFGRDNSISVIDISTHTVVETIVVGDNPNSLVLDANNQLWVACGGYVDYADANNSTVGQLLKIDPSTYAVTTVWNSEKGKGPKDLHLNNNQLFYNKDGALWSYDIATQSETLLVNERFYGIGVSEDMLYGASYSGVNNAWVKRYSLTGSLIDSFQVGQFANGFVFK